MGKMSKDVNTPHRGAPEAPSGSQEASVDLIPAIQAFAKARDVYPEFYPAQQAHFALVLPAAEEALQRLLVDQLSEAERLALIDALCAIEGLRSPTDLDDPADW
jgi:hypothetical protein